jgi:hypothetical protein
MIKSPLTDSEQVVLIEELDSTIVVRKYREEFKIDVSRYFEHNTKIGIY